MTPEEKPSSAERVAQIYANCRNGKQRGVNYAEWNYSYQGHVEGARWQAAQVAEAVGKMEEAERFMRADLEFRLDRSFEAEHLRNALAQLDAALALLKGTK